MIKILNISDDKINQLPNDNDVKTIETKKNSTNNKRFQQFICGKMEEKGRDRYRYNEIM